MKKQITIKEIEKDYGIKINTKEKYLSGWLKQEGYGSLAEIVELIETK